MLESGVMSIWAIADIHASATEPQTGVPIKSMDIFGPQWRDHVARLEQSWQELVGPTDTVIVAGDTDWALHLAEAMETLERIDGWNGRKILLRGNHDYWWSSKMTNRVRRALPPTLALLHNNAFQVEGFNVCGAKGSPVPGGIDWTAENAKLLNRETERLKLSLNARDPLLPTIAALHYPPFYPSHGTSPYREELEAADALACVYGHLHGGLGGGPVGRYGKIEYRLVAADAVGFRPVQLAADGRIKPAGVWQEAESAHD
jgi:predicted phosphohydrolase